MKKLRNKIDKIDDKLLILLNKRLDVVEKIKIYKKENNIQTYDRERETKVLARLIGHNKGKMSREDIKETWELFFKISKKHQGS